jgi:glycosyltransferase involved in cell wall biosynthesis
MKVVLDALQIAPNFSGLGRQALSIGRELSRLPDEVELELRCAADTRPLLEPAFPLRTAVYSPIRATRPRLRRIAWQQAWEPARDRDPMLLVCLGDQGPIWGRPRVLLVVNDVRRLTHPETAPAAERAFYGALVPRAVRHAAVVTTISEFSRGEIRRVLGVDACVVADHPPPRVEQPSGRLDGHILVVGALRPYKGIDTVVEAVGRMKERPRVVVVGKGDVHAAGVEYTGWMGEERLDELYRTAAATVSASQYEGYGLPVAESLSYGLPTIASDIPAHREVAGDAALYFPPGDPAALAEVLARPRDGLGERALERSRELSRLGPRWADVIMDALE